ncbi:MAG TPA: hypothetical protein VF618_07980 [Thermoanaerobaculia bacterium]
MHDRRCALALFVLTLGASVYFYGGWGANQEANYALTRAIVEARTFAIDDFTVREGDIAEGVGGRIYSNKPPGLSALAVVPYAIQYSLQQRGAVTFREYWRTNKQLVTIFTCGLTGALIAPVLFLYGRRTLHVPRWNVVLVTVIIAFGTMVLPYSTMLFAHVPSAFFLLLALTLLRQRPFLAGLSAGIAGACFFLSAIAALILAFLAWSYARRNALLFVAGGVPFAIALAVYQWLCFGSPFTTPVERSTAFTQPDLLLGVFGTARLSSLWAITFSEYRGLFYASPILLFAFAGAVVMIRRRRFRAELAAIAAIALLFLISIASFNGFHGGAAFGPRYLLPIVPLLAIPMMFLADRLRWLWLLGGLFSIAVHVAATAVDPMPLDGLYHPLTGYIMPALRDGKVSLAQDAGNLGEPFFGKGRSLSVVPGALWIVAGSGLLLAWAARRDARDLQVR